jgi:hypothetical protein
MKIDTLHIINMKGIMIRGKMKIQGIGEQIITINIKEMKI